MAKTERVVPPTHPGAILREIVLPELDIGKAEFARRLGVSRTSLYRILDETRSVTPDFATKLGKLLGNGGRIWLDMQMTRDLWFSEKNLRPTLKKIHTIEASA